MASLPYPRLRHNPPTDSTDFHRCDLYKELPQIPRIFTDETYTKNSHRIHRIHRSLGAFIAVWVWQGCHTILYICVNPWNLWEFFSISISVNSVESVGVFSISTSANSVDSVGVFSISTSVNSVKSVGAFSISTSVKSVKSVGGLCRRRGDGKDAIPS